MKIETYNITTSMGSWSSGDKLNFLTQEDLSDLDEIGYTGKLRGVKIDRESFLNSLGKGEFVVTKTKYDSGDFVEKFIITRVVKEKNSNTLQQSIDDKLRSKVIGLAKQGDDYFLIVDVHYGYETFDYVTITQFGAVHSIYNTPFEVMQHKLFPDNKNLLQMLEKPFEFNEFINQFN